MDLLSIDISRNRDHGLAPYHEYLKLATGQEICDWFDYFTVFSYDVSCYYIQVALTKIY